MVMILERELYEINISGAVWRVKLAGTLNSHGYNSSKTDIYVWIKWYFKINREHYYKYMLCYIDDLLRIFFKPKEDMDALNLIYRLREGI